MNDTKFKMLEDCATLLKNAVTIFTKVIPVPEYTETVAGHFRHREGDERIFVVLRCVRITSAVYSCLILLRHGFIQETGVLIRTIIEFTHDIDFVVDGLVHKEHVLGVKERMKTFFEDDYHTENEWMKETSKALTTPRKKIYAASARLFGGSNLFRDRQISKTLEDAYSGYVHGNYPHIMELYDGDHKQFQTTGIISRVPEWLELLAHSVHPVLNVFAAVAIAFGMPSLEKALIEHRKVLEESEIYKDT